MRLAAKFTRDVAHINAVAAKILYTDHEKGQEKFLKGSPVKQYHLHHPRYLLSNASEVTVLDDASSTLI